MHNSSIFQSPYFNMRHGILIFIGLAGMIIFFGPTDNWSWDPSFYYAQIRSPLIENDLDFRNETATGNVQTAYTVTGLQHSGWPIGPSILWSPYFLMAHLVVLSTNPAQANGFYFLYISLVALGSVGYGIAGLLIIYKICRYFANRAYSLAAISLCLGATPLFFYMFRQPIMAHTTGLFASATIVLLYMVLSESISLSKKSGLLFGISLGLCFLTRWNGILLSVMPLFYFAGHLHRAISQRCLRKVRLVIQQLIIMLGVFIFTISPQLALWYRLHHNFLTMPQRANTFVSNIVPVNLLNIFIDTNRGLIFWCPFVLIGMAGVALIPNLKVKLIAVISLASQLVLIGYRVDWFSGGGYGARYFIETLPFVALGFVCLAQRIFKRAHWKLLMLSCIVALFFHQFSLMHSVEHASNEWINHSNYIKGKPIGVRWQLDSFTNLVRDPSLWIAPRPHVGEDRQTILINYLSGTRNPKMYLITGTSAILSPFFVIIYILLYKLVNRNNLHILFIGIMGYFAAWSVYLLIFVG